MTQAAYDPTHGIRDDALAHLTPKDKALVLRLLARVSEQSYRRGAQQGATIKDIRPGSLPTDLGAWRYGQSLDKAPGVDGFNCEGAEWRLQAECGSALDRVGLRTLTPATY